MEARSDTEENAYMKWRLDEFLFYLSRIYSVLSIAFGGQGQQTKKHPYPCLMEFFKQFLKHPEAGVGVFPHGDASPWGCTSPWGCIPMGDASPWGCIPMGMHPHGGCIPLGKHPYPCLRVFKKQFFKLPEAGVGVFLSLPIGNCRVNGKWQVLIKACGNSKHGHYTLTIIVPW